MARLLTGPALVASLFLIGVPALSVVHAQSSSSGIVCSAEPATAFPNDPVRFVASSSGARWEFSDGTTTSTHETRHAFPEPGVYTATFTTADGATCSTTVTIEDAFCEEVIELNDVYFGRNTSRIDDGTVDRTTALRLEENLELLLLCTSLRIEVEGVAQVRERRPKALAEARAEAVAAHYIAAGVDADRIQIREGVLASSSSGGGPIEQDSRVRTHVAPPQR